MAISPVEPSPLVLEREYRFRVDEADWTGQARPVTLLNLLQDAAFSHAALLGVGVPELRQRHLTWVLTRYRARFLAYPTAGFPLTVRTWPSSRDRRATTRDFEITAGGKCFLLATSAWALLDLHSHRPIRLDEALPEYPLDSRRALDFSPDPLPILQQIERELPFRVRLGDLDINRHVNNSVYIQWALEATPAEMAEAFRPAEIDVAYRAEALFGDTVLSRLQQEKGEDAPSFLHQLVSRENGREFARLRTLWRQFPA